MCGIVTELGNGPLDPDGGRMAITIMMIPDATGSGPLGLGPSAAPGVRGGGSSLHLTAPVAMARARQQRAGVPPKSLRTTRKAGGRAPHGGPAAQGVHTQRGGGGGARGQGFKLGRWFWIGSSFPLGHGTLISVMEYILKTTEQGVSFSPLFLIVHHPHGNGTP